MNTSNVVNEVFTDLQKGQFNRAGDLLADNFHSTILGKAVDKSGYISTYRAILQGMPDMKFHVQDVRTEGGKITVKVSLSGTNNLPIPALMKGWRQIPATHKKIEGLVAGLEVTLNGDKIEEIKSQGQEKGLFINLLDHLGLDYRKLQEN
jgi:predicted ester cyclase